MRGAATVIGLLFALGGGYVLYQAAATRGGAAPGPPQEQVDVIGIRAELLAIGAAEDRYLVAHGGYATLEELAAERLLPGGADRRGYTVSIAVDGSRGYTVTARSSQAGRPTFSMNETKQVSER